MKRFCMIFYNHMAEVGAAIGVFMIITYPAQSIITPILMGTALLIGGTGAIFTVMEHVKNK